jgi:hypothetical protein
MAIENQPLQASRHVFEAEEVEITRRVVADEADDDEPQVIAARQRRFAAARPGVRESEERRSHEHAQRDQCRRIYTVPVGQLDDDRLAREQDAARHREREAGQERAAMRGRVGGRVGHARIVRACTRDSRGRSWQARRESRSHVGAEQ